MGCRDRRVPYHNTTLVLSEYSINSRNAYWFAIANADNRSCQAMRAGEQLDPGCVTHNSLRAVLVFSVTSYGS